MNSGRCEGRAEVELFAKGLEASGGEVVLRLDRGCRREW